MLKQTKDNVPVFFKPIELTSKRGNKYILQINSKGKSDFKKKDLLFITYMYYHRPEGIYAVMVASQGVASSADDFYNIYTPHFFDRYRERELKNIHMPKMEAIIDFFTHNATSKHVEVESEKYKDSLFYTVPTGVMLGNKYNDYICEIKTYITFDMLRGNQVDNSEKLIDDIKYHIENVQ